MRARSPFVVIHLALVIGVSASAACGADDAAQTSEGGAPPDVVADAPSCDPSTDPKCIDETKGIFVSPTGTPGGAGTKADPISTLANALAKAKSTTKPRLYVCEGSYAGSVDVGDPIAIYGGFACADWKFNGTKPVVQADKPAYGMKITANVDLFDPSMVGKAGAAPGESSIWVLAWGTIAVQVTRLRVQADAGG